MNLYISRNGQTFGPYPAEQAKTFLESNQLLASDLALIEGTSEWKPLPEILFLLSKDSQPAEKKVQQTEAKVPEIDGAVNEANVRGSKEKEPEEKKIKKKTKKAASKVQKLKRAKGGQIIMVAQEKSFIAKIFSTIFVFIFLFLLAVGGIAGAYFAMPSKMGPILARFGLNIEEFTGESPTEQTATESKSPNEIMLSEDAWNTLRSSGIRILPMVAEKGLQVISSVDPELAMKDEDLEKLLIIAPHIISLDLTDSQVSNAGIDHIAKMPNLKKLFLEGTDGIDASGIAKLKDSKKLEYLNLIRVKLEASVIDSLISLESLREIYLFDSGLGDTEIGRLKSARPKVFVNSG